MVITNLNVLCSGLGTGKTSFIKKRIRLFAIYKYIFCLNKNPIVGKYKEVIGRV